MDMVVLAPEATFVGARWLNGMGAGGSYNNIGNEVNAKLL